MLARNAYRRARSLLADNRECLDDLAANALERETLTREDLDEIFAAHELASAEQWRPQETTPAITSPPAVR
jgi:ATP-dependent Zn protease